MPPRSDNKKLKLMAPESDEDRISALSDRVIHRVLSFLPPHEAVQTCLLSRRWRGIWKSMPVLCVDAWRFRGSAAEFNKFVNHLLFFRDVTPLEEFEVKTYPYVVQMLSDAFADSVEPFRYLQMWIRYSLMRKVRVLRVAIFSHKPQRSFNGPLFSQHLVTIELSCVVLDGCSMDFSRCPLLEDLKISDCRISAHKMLSQSIRRLCITGCEFPDYATRLQIFVPNLSSLRLERNDGLTPFLGSMPLLVAAVVRLHYRSDAFRDRCRHTKKLGDYCGLDPCIDCYGSEKCVVLGGLSIATSLQFEIRGLRPWENILKRDLKWCLPFSKLRTLVLNGWVVGLAGCDVRGLICFLQRTPILEKLVLQIYDELTYKRKMDESCSLVKQFIPTEHLKIVEVSCRQVVQNVDKLVETLIACGIPPNIISIKRIYS